MNRIVNEQNLGFDTPAFTSSAFGCPQRTLKTAIGCTGVGLHSGSRVTMTLRPAAPDTGICFRRVDIAGGGGIVTANWATVNDTRLNTCLRNNDGVAVGTVEHLMAALSGMQIDNCLIDINGPEVPVMDGSAAPFLFMIECAGTLEQSAPRRAIKVLKRVTVRNGDKVASLSPASSFSVRVEIDFDSTAIARQEFFLGLSERSFKAEVARARTFGFEQEVAMLRANGLARGGSLDNAVVIDSTGTKVLNDDGLRYGNEFVRHKVLDAVGDLYLAGGPILGHFSGIRTGHAINNQLLRQLFADSSAYSWVDLAAVPVEIQAPEPMRAVVNG
ncbi:UDP-3-O-acyl-N-acetylglucosamine deacetylase [Magnetospirillum molischianum]|uniref:UDP-3-O-acyl-N-acetylglucosamine deacetylase n=1 Tax=Magnetospirillum molischianum DSM 120 TaxID=1150626 RepID=H8FMP7_MAGML|nr:UDP-3-O-acyl-N-acetylglucosamine deacetylase [Magnetospirillum molischianum]CCG39635.1 UDP-3-O-acyl N-acetylglucosamine deacetylase [Magnetospirillum molischianum DSM 120]